MAEQKKHIAPCPFCGCEYSKGIADYWYTGDHEDWCPLGLKSNFTIGQVMFLESDIDNWNRRVGR